MLKLFITAALAAVAVANGCGKPHNAGFNNGTSTHSIVSGGITRTYAVYVPDSYNNNPNKQRSLIFDYHGSGGTPYNQYQNSQYYLNSAGKEYLVVYPAGVNGNWQYVDEDKYIDRSTNLDRGPTYATKGVDDVKFTSDLLDHIQSEYCVNPSNVYASGKSNGGGFVDTLACSDTGDKFAAFAMASAALYTDTSLSSCSKKRAILESHGDLDTTIPYHPTKPGRGGPLPDITQWVSWWGQRTCGPYANAQNSGNLGGYNTTTYSCGNWNDVIDHYQIFKLGHCWPSSTGQNYDALQPDQATRKCLDKSLDFTQVVVDFFGRWSINTAPKKSKKRTNKHRKNRKST